MNHRAAISLPLLLGAGSAFIACARSPVPETATGAKGQQAESAAPPSAPLQKPRASNSGQCTGLGLIDDFEDGDNRGLITPVTGGYWYTYKDPSSQVSPQGTFEVTAGGAHESTYAGRMHGQVGSQQYPYVGMGVSFTHPKQAFDASCCEGVRFWGKSTGDGISDVRLKVGDWQTDPAGGACKECFNDFGAYLTFTETWQEFTIKFADMRQEPYWGEPKAALDTSAIYQIQWQVSQNGRPFDITVDDVQLVGCSGTTAPAAAALPTAPVTPAGG